MVILPAVAPMASRSNSSTSPGAKASGLRRVGRRCSHLGTADGAGGGALASSEGSVASGSWAQAAEERLKRKTARAERMAVVLGCEVKCLQLIWGLLLASDGRPS